jgi:hypothetical protein
MTIENELSRHEEFAYRRLSCIVFASTYLVSFDLKATLNAKLLQVANAKMLSLNFK